MDGLRFGAIAYSDIATGAAVFTLEISAPNPLMSVGEG